jgi:hypothetical protein
MPWCPEPPDGAQIPAADKVLFEYQKLSAEVFVGNPIPWRDELLSRDSRFADAMPRRNSLADHIVGRFHALADFIQDCPLPRLGAVSIG